MGKYLPVKLKGKKEMHRHGIRDKYPRKNTETVPEM